MHVYRLISEGTVEERIVTRAEQKLYLDTGTRRLNKSYEMLTCILLIVVTGGRHRTSQPGTLSMKDLLPMLKFGAERIFNVREKTEAIRDFLGLTNFLRILGYG